MHELPADGIYNFKQIDLMETNKQGFYHEIIENSKKYVNASAHEFPDCKSMVKLCI